MSVPKDKSIVIKLLKKRNKSYHWVKKDLKKLGWKESRIIKATDFLFK